MSDACVKNEFCKMMIELRLENNESLRTMAKRLDITPAFLSAMEVGRKAIPLEYADKIANEYNLDIDEKNRLVDSIYKTNEKVPLELSKMSEAQKNVSLLFARRINNADDDLIKKLQEVLMNDKDKSTKC